MPLTVSDAAKRTVTSDGNGSILLKNSFSTDREKISAVIGCDARFKLGGYVEDAMSRCKASWAI